MRVSNWQAQGWVDAFMDEELERIASLFQEPWLRRMAPWLLMWVVWAGLLLSTPFLALDSYSSSVGSSLYAYVALGVLCGAAATHVAIRRGRDAHPALALLGRGMIAVGAACAVAMFLADGMLSAPVEFVIEPLLRSLQRVLPLRMGMGAPVVFALSAACPVSLGFLLLDAPGGGDGEDPDPSSTGRSDALAPRRTLVLASLGTAFVFGLAHYAAVFPFLLRGMGAGFAQAARSSMPPLFFLAPSVVALAVGVLFLVIGLVLARERKGEATPRFRFWCIASPLAATCCGMLVWNAATRVVGVRSLVGQMPLGGRVALYVFLALCLALLFVCCRRALLASSDQEGEADYAQGEPDSSDPEPEGSLPNGSAASDPASSTPIESVSAHAAAAASDLLAQAPLTERERVAIELLLQGKSSAEAADEMGVKASTVRSYQQRAYKKLGVAHAEELKELLHSAVEVGEPSVSDDSDALDRGDQPEQASAASLKTAENLRAESVAAGEGGPSAARGRSRARDNVLFLVSVMGSFGLPLSGFIAHDVPYDAWGIGRQFIVGYGVALVAVGACLVARAWIAARWGDGGASRTRVHSAAWPVVLRAGLGLLVLAAGSAVVFAQLSIHAGAYRWGGLLTACVMLGSGILGVGWCRCVYRMVSMARSARFRSGAAARVALVAASLFGVAAVVPFGWLVVLVASVVAVALACAVRCNGGACDALHPEISPIAPPWMASFVFLGWFIEETWRSLGSFSFIDMAFLFLFVWSASALLYLWFARRRLRRWLPVPVLALACCVYAGSVLGAASVALGVILVSLLDGALPAGALRRAGAWACVCVGAGCLVGLVVGDACSDFLTLTVPAVASPDLAEVSLHYLTVVPSALFAASAVLAVWCCRQLYAAALVPDSKVIDSAKDRERVRHALMGRGLNETQAAVALAIVDGKTSAQISEELNYSRGTINSARAAVYRRLDVHSRLQLVETVRREFSL